MKKYKIEDLDITNLTEVEVINLKRLLSSRPISWRFGIFCAISIMISMTITLFRSENPESTLLIGAVFKTFIYVILSLWTRTWSLLAVFLLLLWHLYSNNGMLYSGNIMLKVFYIGFACVFLWGVIASNARRVLINKTQNL